MPPPKLPNSRSASLSPVTTFARRKKAKRDRHAQRKKETSLARDNHAPVTGNPHSRCKRRQDQKSTVDPSERRLSLRSRWRSEDLASKNRGNDEVRPYTPLVTQTITISHHRTFQDEPSC